MCARSERLSSDSSDYTFGSSEKSDHRVGILISQALRNQGETEAKTQRQVLKCGTEMTIFFINAERLWREMNQHSSTLEPGREVQNQLTEEKLNHHNLEISNARYIEKVFANVRQKLNRPEDGQIVLDQNVNVLLWVFLF